MKHIIFSVLRIAVLLLLAIHGMTASSQALAPAVSYTSREADDILEATQKTVITIQDRLQDQSQETDDAALALMRDDLQKAQSIADSIAAQQEPELTGVQRRLKELGAPNAGKPEPPDIAQQRTQLTQHQTTLDAQVRLAHLLAVEAGQGQDKIEQLQRARFQAQLGKRSPAILTATFWQGVLRDMPRDMERLSGLGRLLVDRMEAIPLQAWSVAVMLALALLTCTTMLHRRLAAFTIRHTSPSRLRRSIFAVLTVILYTLVPGLWIFIILHTFRWGGEPETIVETFLAQCMSASYIAGFVAGTGKILLLPDQPSWRLPQITDRLATKLARLPVLFAVTVALAWATQRVLELVNASLFTTLLMNGVMTVTLDMLIGFTAWKLRLSMRTLAHEAVTEDKPRSALPVSPWVHAVPSVLTGIVAISLSAFLLGFVALSSLIVQEIIWMSLVACTTYLLLVLVADISGSLVVRVGKESKAERISEQQASVLCQLLVICSGCLRLFLVLSAITLLLLPLGEAPDQWLQRRLGFLTAGFQMGEITIKPTSVVLAMTLLLLGIFMVKILKSWMVHQFLPVTRLDEKMRAPTARLLSYLAYFTVGIITISSLGIELERMAWIVSALSVGIGFGLQAVVQNFVSGVILLMERSVKVGDWVSLGEIEGNVRRISARATEIEMFDRSTMIVPNSKFVTKMVRNVTMANPMGLVSVQFNMPLDADADAVHTVVHDTIVQHPDVLENPAPTVSLQGFNESSLTFSASCHVGSPRSAAHVRSALMFEILRNLRQAGLIVPVVQPVIIADPAVSPQTGALSAKDPPQH